MTLIWSYTGILTFHAVGTATNAASSCLPVPITTTLSNLQKKDHPKVIILNALLLPLNLEVDLLTPCSGDCAAAAYVMLNNNVNQWGSYWFLSKPFLMAVDQCRKEVADFMQANSVILRIADRYEIISNAYEKEIIIVRTSGAYVDVDLFYTALASLKGILIQMVSSTSLPVFDHNWGIVEENIRTMKPILGISKQGPPSSAVTVLTVAYAVNPSNHVYATKKLMSITDGDDPVDKSMLLSSAAATAEQISSIKPSQLDTDLICIDNQTPMEVGTPCDDGPSVIALQLLNSASVEENLEPCVNALAAATTGLVTTVKGAPNMNVQREMTLFLQTSSLSHLADHLQCSVGKLRRYLTNTWKEQVKYDDFEAIFKSFVTATTCVGLVPNLGAPVWYVDEVHHIYARIISMGKGKALSNFLAGPRHLRLFLYAGFTLRIKFSTKNPSAIYELTVLSDAMHNGVFKVREIKLFCLSLRLVKSPSTPTPI